MFEVAFRTCDCRRVCLILSASCSSSTVAEAVKLLEDRGQVFEDLGEKLEHLEGQKTLLKLQLVYWKETIWRHTNWSFIKQAAEKGSRRNR